MPRPPRREAPEPLRRDWWVAVLAVGGLAVAGYLAWTKWSSGTALFCVAGGGCDVVRASRYAVFLGFPTAAWGAALYAAIGALALWGLAPRRWLAAFLLAMAGAAFSLYLTYLEFFVLGAVCGYCVASTLIILALVAALVLRRPPPAGRRSPVRPARLVALGALTAVITVVVGAGVFATPSPREAAAYQDALARHLKATDAVMYGAYW